MSKVRIVANRRTSKAKVGLGESEVWSPLDLFDAVMGGMTELRRRKIRRPYWVKVYVVGWSRDWLLASFLTTDALDEIDHRCGQVFSEVARLAAR